MNKNNLINFDWKFYVKYHKDLNNITSEKEAINHWINYGKHEYRFKNYSEFSNHIEFDWNFYVKYHKDLNNIASEKEALNHWINYGKHEKRLINRKKLFNLILNSKNKKIKDDTEIYFIHIPKTGGSTLMKSNRINYLDHKFNVPNVYRIPASKKGYSGYVRDKWPMYYYPKFNNFKITIIRNPFDLLCSYYHYNQKLDLNGNYCDSGWGSCNYTHQFKSFREFIIAYCDPKFNWHVPALKNFLFSQLFDENNLCVPDIIIKLEFLDDAIKILNSKLTTPINFKEKRNVNKNKKNYKYYYDEELKNLVYKKCERELKYFNYDFNGSTKNDPIFNINLKYDVFNDKILSI